MHMQLRSDVDVAIIGAGAAGLAAYRALAGHGLSVIVLEARDRIGGRALTMHLPGGILFDLGCEWLHSADQNAFVPIAEAGRFGVVQTGSHWAAVRYDNNFSADEQRDFPGAPEAFFHRLGFASAKP